MPAKAQRTTAPSPSLEEFHRLPAKTPVALNLEKDKRVAVGLHPQVPCPVLQVPSGCCCCSCCSHCRQEDVDGEGVHDADVRDGDALGKGYKDIPPSLDMDAGAISEGAGAASEAGEGGRKGGGNAGPVHNLAQIPFQDIMAQRDLCSKGRASHCEASVGQAQAAASEGEGDLVGQQ
jgi:hypothetical protein